RSITPTIAMSRVSRYHSVGSRLGPTVESRSNSLTCSRMSRSTHRGSIGLLLRKFANDGFRKLAISHRPWLIADFQNCATILPKIPLGRQETHSSRCSQEVRMKIVVFAIILSAMTTPLAAQWVDYPTPGIPRTADGKPNLIAPAPRTADGKPDLSGIWQRMSLKYERNIAADLKPGEIQPWAEALVRQRAEDLQKDHMSVQCLPWGPSYSNSARKAKIVQTPGLLLMLDEDLTYRQIFLDGRPLETEPNPSWMGYSVGRWEGDTLVVDSVGFNDRTWLDRDGHPHSEALRMTERYRRPDFGHMQIEITLNDPKVYGRPWTVSLSAELNP